MRISMYSLLRLRREVISDLLTFYANAECSQPISKENTMLTLDEIKKKSNSGVCEIKMLNHHFFATSIPGLDAKVCQRFSEAFELTYRRNKTFSDGRVSCKEYTVSSYCINARAFRNSWLARYIVSPFYC
jgi:hypothetical protein